MLFSIIITIVEVGLYLIPFMIFWIKGHSSLYKIRNKPISNYWILAIKLIVLVLGLLILFLVKGPIFNPNKICIFSIMLWGTDGILLQYPENIEEKWFKIDGIIIVIMAIMTTLVIFQTN